MGSIWQIALSNAVLVAAGAPIVWLVGRYSNRPALTHGLAVVLLLKLITPPLFRVPISWPEEPVASKPAIQKDVARDLTLPPLAEATSVSPVPNWQTTSGTVVIEAPPVSPVPAAVADPPAVVQAVTPPSGARYGWAHWLRRRIAILGWIWIAGCASYGLVATTRIVRFTRSLRFARRARDVQPRADLMARRLGLARSPAVWFVPAFISPMLWSLGRRPRLLLPQGLWDRLDIAGRDTILLHELAHWRRGDHWVRWIELLATCLYWWHPACWWARRELREAEEQCCDAWVLWAMPGVFKNYANALLEAVEFASIGSDRPSARRAVPALASRMGQFVHLRRRLTMLKHGNISRALSWGGLAGVMTLGSILLPLTPTWGQEQPAQPDDVRVDPTAPQPTPSETAPAAPAATPAPAPVAPPSATPESVAPRSATAATPGRTANEAPEGQIDQGKLAHTEADLARAQRTIIQLEAELAVTRDQMRVLEARVNAQQWAKPGAAGAPSYAPVPPVAPVPPAIPAPRALPVPEKSPFSAIAPDSAPSIYITPRSGPTPGVVAVIRDPVTGKVSEFQAGSVRIDGPGTLGIDGPGSLRTHGADRVQSESERLDRIEGQLRMMMDEIARMRQAGSTQSDAAPGTMPPSLQR